MRATATLTGLALFAAAYAIGQNTRDPLPGSTEPRNGPAAVVERRGCFGSCPSYEVEIHSDGRTVWNGYEDVAVTGRAQGRADVEEADIVFQKVFPTAEREICISEAGVDSPVYFILFSRSGDLDLLRKQRDEIYRLRQSDLTISEPCSIYADFEAVMTQLERLANSHRWLHGHESIRDVRKVGEDIALATKPGVTPLMLAAGNGELEKVESLVQRETVNQEDETGWTAIMLASAGCHSDVVRTLLSAGADPNHQDKNGDNSLIAAAAGSCNRFDSDEQPKERYDLVKLLVDAGVTVNLANGKGQTALMIAAQFANPEAVRALLQSHGDARLRDKSGMKAAGYAEKYRREVRLYNRDYRDTYRRRFQQVIALLSQADPAKN